MFKMKEEEITSRIKHLIKYVGLNEVNFAKYIGISQSTFNKQMNGVNNITLKTLIHIVSSFPNVSLDWLVCGNGDMFHTQAAAQQNYAHICKQMADMYAEIQSLRKENVALKTK